jgi:phosphatidylserine/phosphatidylglycerophosphate/cardiolipin synthase-like enzyme
MPAEAAVRVRTIFAPFDNTTEEYLAFVQSAARSITIIIYGMHLPTLTALLIAKHQAGVKVNLILDHSQAEGRAESQEVQKLVDAGVPLLIGTSPVHGQILHTKATIIDEAAVESGSWNYSLSASAQSNTLTFVHDADYARAYLEHWSRIRSFIILHDMIYQPKGEASTEDVPAADRPSGDSGVVTPFMPTTSRQRRPPTPAPTASLPAALDAPIP